MTLDEQRAIGSGFTATSSAADVMAGIDLTGRTAVVTGGSSGLGAETARALSIAGARVIVLAHRSAATNSPLTGSPAATVFDGLELADLGSVARVADAITGTTDRIDLFVAAAGVMATPHRRVGVGWDHQLTVNHLGHFALVARLSRLLAAASARVIVYSSAGHHASDIRWRDPHFLTGYDKWTAYGQSKTANALFALHLDVLGQVAGVRAFSLHPGKILTGLQRDLPIKEQIELGWIDAAGAVVDKDFKSRSQGASTGLWAATSSLLDGRGGLYLEDCDVAAPAESAGASGTRGVQPYALDPDAAERLWQLTSAMTATDFVA